MFCRKYQYAIENQLDDLGTVQDPVLLEHLKDCSRCRVFYEQLVRMETKLRSTVALDVTDKQVENIYAAVSQRIAETNPVQSASPMLPPVHHFRLHYGLTAAAAMLLLVLGSILYFHLSRPPQISDPAAAFVNNTAVFQNRLSMMARLPEQSMQNEIQKLTGNARSALNFLANCIPASPTAIDLSQSRDE